MFVREYRSTLRLPMPAISPIERALDILELLADCPEGVSVSELSRQLSLQKSVAHRMLAVLVKRGFAAQDAASQRYRLAIQAAALGLRFFGKVGLGEVCQPIIDRLAQRTGEFIRICAAEDGRLTWIASSQGASGGL